MGLAEFVLVATLVEITPGPNMAYLASLAAVHGRRAGIQAVLGILLGLAAYGILAAFGLAALVGASPTLYAALRFAGVAYMLWLAVEAWRDGDCAATCSWCRRPRGRVSGRCRSTPRCDGGN